MSEIVKQNQFIAPNNDYYESKIDVIIPFISLNIFWVLKRVNSGHLAPMLYCIFVFIIQ